MIVCVCWRGDHTFGKSSRAVIRQFVELGLAGRWEMRTYNAGKEEYEQWTTNLYVILALLLVGDELSRSLGRNGDQP